MTMTEFMIRIAVAFLLGTAIGFERQWRQRMAGLRTNTLVAVGSALFVTTGLMTTDDVSPTRIAAQVVSGIGFLGAGVILRDGLNVRGLNTAATLWAAAAVGVLAGSGFILHAIYGTVLIVLANVVLRPLSRIVDDKSKPRTVRYRFAVSCAERREAKFRRRLIDLVRAEGFRIQRISSQDKASVADEVLLRLELLSEGNKDSALETVAGVMAEDPDVRAVTWSLVPEEPTEPRARRFRLSAR